MICPECACDHRLVIEACQKDLLAFCKIMCGYVVGDEHELEPSDNVHGRIARWHLGQEQSGRRETAIFIPRNWFKSSIYTVARTLQKLTINPNKRFGIFSASGDLTSKWVGQMERIITSQSEQHGFSHYFPNLVPPSEARTNWNKTEFTINRKGIYTQPSVKALSVGSSVTGGKYTDIILDDLLDEKTWDSPAEVAAAVSFYRDCRKLWANPRTGTLLINATRWPCVLYDEIIKDKHISKIVLGMLRDERWEEFSGEPADGGLVWPEGSITMEEFHREFEKDAFTTSHQRLNLVTERSMRRFTEDQVQYFVMDAKRERIAFGPQNAESFPRSELAIRMIVDPSTGEGRDESAIIVCGWHRNRCRAFVLEAWSERVLPDPLITKIFEIYLRWAPMQAFSIEEAAGFKMLKHFVTNAQRQRTEPIFLPWRNDIQPAGRSKDSRIVGNDGLQPFFANHQVYLQRDQRKLLQQLLDYDPARDQLDDLVDCLAYHSQSWVYTPKTEYDPDAIQLIDAEASKGGTDRWYGLECAN